MPTTTHAYHEDHRMYLSKVILGYRIIAQQWHSKTALRPRGGRHCFNGDITTACPWSLQYNEALFFAVTINYVN